MIFKIGRDQLIITVTTVNITPLFIHLTARRQVVVSDILENKNVGLILFVPVLQETTITILNQFDIYLFFIISPTK